MLRLFAGALVLALSSNAFAAQPDPEVWREFAKKLSIGSEVKVRLADGTRFRATLMDATDETMLLKPKTRVPVAPQRVAYGDVESLDVVQPGGIGTGKAVAIGIVAGAGAFVALLLAVFASVSD